MIAPSECLRTCEIVREAGSLSCEDEQSEEGATVAGGSVETDVGERFWLRSSGSGPRRARMTRDEVKTNDVVVYAGGLKLVVLTISDILAASQLGEPGAVMVMIAIWSDCGC